MPETTRRVRICVVIDPDGKWEAVGSHSWDDKTATEQANDFSGGLGGPPWGYHWIEADIPLPIGASDRAIEGEVVQ